MALQRKTTSCEDHNVAIELLKKDMEAKTRHDSKFSKAIEDFDMAIKDLNVSIVKINATLEHFKDTESRLRKLEDKSIVVELVKNLGWVILTILLTAYLGQFFIATKEEKGYNLESNK